MQRKNTIASVCLAGLAGLLGLVSACTSSEASESVDDSLDAAIPDGPSIYDGVAPGECWLAEGTCLPREVDEILEAKCRQCHGEPTEMYAPMALVTWEDFLRNDTDAQANNALRTQVRIHQSRTPMPPITFPQLTDAERAVLNDWVDAGYPPGP